MEKKAWHEPQLKRLDVLLTENSSDGNGNGSNNPGQGNPNDTGNGGNGNHYGWQS